MERRNANREKNKWRRTLALIFKMWLWWQYVEDLSVIVIPRLEYGGRQPLRWAQVIPASWCSWYGRPCVIPSPWVVRIWICLEESVFLPTPTSLTPQPSLVLGKASNPCGEELMFPANSQPQPELGNRFFSTSAVQRCLQPEPTPWLQHHGRPLARITKLNQSQIPDPYELK